VSENRPHFHQYPSETAQYPSETAPPRAPPCCPSRFRSSFPGHGHRHGQRRPPNPQPHELRRVLPFERRPSASRQTMTIRTPASATATEAPHRRNAAHSGTWWNSEQRAQAKTRPKRRVVARSAAQKHPGPTHRGQRTGGRWILIRFRIRAGGANRFIKTNQNKNKK
jgi:hypothetical protein